MENKAIAQQLRLLAQLMELHDRPAFKIRSINAAAFNVNKHPAPLAGLSAAELEAIPGIGKSTAGKIGELVSTGELKELASLAASTPPGILEMLSIKGIGPRKIRTIWKELNIENTGELYYACNENRLVTAKGFGAQTQDNIKTILEFTMRNKGKYLYAALEPFAVQLSSLLETISGIKNISFSGGYRRKCEVLEELEFVLEADTDNIDNIKSILSKEAGLTDLSTEDRRIIAHTHENLKIVFHLSEKGQFAYTLFRTTGSKEHLVQLSQVNDLEDYRKAASEQEIYHLLGIQFIVPEMREGRNEVSLASSKQIPELIRYQHIKGTLHNHTTYSDGIHTLEEMALQCIEYGLDYLGVCDHSRSAFYANGLNEERVKEQHAEIGRLNEKLAPFRIFKGIESDILYDGSLDYPDDVLDTFDFVVASVHSQLRMTEEKATDRLIKAIENPFTTILGHPTGRLLLARQGYPIDHKKVIDACAANQVVLELNANPLRLDIDWRWIEYASGKQVLISINPDAHRKEALKDMQYGVYVARKAGLSPSRCFNTWTADQVANWFKKRVKNQEPRIKKG